MDRWEAGFLRWDHAYHRYCCFEHFEGCQEVAEMGDWLKNSFPDQMVEEL